MKAVEKISERIMNGDFPEVSYVDNRLDFNPIRSRGIVVGCEEGIGITIVDANNKDRYLVCLIGPLSPLWAKTTPVVEEKINGKLFDFMVGMIKDGEVSVNKYIEYLSQIRKKNIMRCRLGRASREVCSFNQ